MPAHEKILSLLSGIDDPSIRLEVLRTVQYLYEVYASGQASEDEIRNDLIEVLLTVITAKHPELTQEEARKMAEEMANSIMIDFKMTTMTRRLMRMRRMRTAGGGGAAELPI